MSNVLSRFLQIFVSQVFNLLLLLFILIAYIVSNGKSIGSSYQCFLCYFWIIGPGEARAARTLRSCARKARVRAAAVASTHRGAAHTIRGIFSYVAKAFSEISTSRSPVSLLKLGQMMLVPVENATIFKYNNRMRYSWRKYPC